MSADPHAAYREGRRAVWTELIELAQQGIEASKEPRAALAPVPAAEPDAGLFIPDFGVQYAEAALSRPAIDPERLRDAAHKAAQIGFTYGALGRDFEYVFKNVEDMLAEYDRLTREAAE